MQSVTSLLNSIRHSVAHVVVKILQKLTLAGLLLHSEQSHDKPRKYRATFPRNKYSESSVLSGHTQKQNNILVGSADLLLIRVGLSNAWKSRQPKRLRKMLVADIQTQKSGPHYSIGQVNATAALLKYKPPYYSIVSLTT